MKKDLFRKSRERDLKIRKAPGVGREPFCCKIIAYPISSCNISIILGIS